MLVSPLIAFVLLILLPVCEVPRAAEVTGTSADPTDNGRYLSWKSPADLAIVGRDDILAADMLLDGVTSGASEPVRIPEANLAARTLFSKALRALEHPNPAILVTNKRTADIPLQGSAKRYQQGMAVLLDKPRGCQAADPSAGHTLEAVSTDCLTG